MKHTSWLVAGGTVAGLVAVLSYHTRQMPAIALGGSGPQPAATAPAATAPAARTSLAAKAVTRTAQGPVEQFGYGQLDVDVTVTGNHIMSVTVPSLQTAEPTSQQISEQAIPLLTSEVLSAQGLNINAVSGATYTSEAYAQSLQGALDKLHVK
ncbi:MAG: FMN-binding protein [Actinomycetia bacterium]|nr:FMN-binding protein [Actinomycetes bacterium]